MTAPIPAQSYRGALPKPTPETKPFWDGAKAGKESVVIISADASAKHQAVVTVMEAARRSGLSQITFATQSSTQAGAK